MSEKTNDYKTIKVRYDHPVCFLQLYRPESKNTINGHLISECHNVLDRYRDSMTILVLEGLPEMFCFGVDFEEVRSHSSEEVSGEWNSESLYNLWLRMANDSFVTISHVQGKVNAGGMGFIAASDIVIADDMAMFSLSELLFGIIPACVLPFLIRRVGFQKANYMTLTTHTVSAKQAYDWGIVDIYGDRSDNLLRKELLRLRGIPKKGISRYRQYISKLYSILQNSKKSALSTNREIFTDPEVKKRVLRFLETGRLIDESKDDYEKKQIKVENIGPELSIDGDQENQTKVKLAKLAMLEDKGTLGVEKDLVDNSSMLLSSLSKPNINVSNASNKSNMYSIKNLTQFPELIHLNQINEGNPIFWIHTPVGSVTLYLEIAKLAERPFYGIEMRGRVGKRYPLRGIPAMAAYYIHIIQSIQPNGPYDLGGCSGGGTIAYEITRQLQELGQTVTNIVMVDTVWAGQFEDVKGFSSKSYMLSMVNSSLRSAALEKGLTGSHITEIQIHCDDVDCSVDEAEYFNQLLTIVNNKEIIRNKRLFLSEFKKNIELSKAYDPNNYVLYPLRYPDDLKCYYFRNKSGLFYGESRPYNIADQKEMNIDHKNYWEIWRKQLSSFNIIDLDSTSHMDILINPKSKDVILDFCKRLYSKDSH